MYDRDAIIAGVDLRVLAEEMLGLHTGGGRSPTWPCPNPAHVQTGRTPPVNVFTSHRGEQRWRCHGCGEGGTAIDLVMICRGVDARDAIEQLASRAGHVPSPPDWQPTQHSQSRPHVVHGCSDPDGLAAYVESCARTLWQPEGSAIRSWLIEERGLPESVLRANQIGADLGARRQPRPDGMWRMGGAVLPVIARGEVVYAQLRVPHPGPDRPRYLNPSRELAPNPRLSRFRPSIVEHPEVIITEGAIDGLSAAAAGYRAVAVLSAGYPDQGVAHALSRLPHPLAIAFDPDDAGRSGADRLALLLENEMRPAAIIDLEHGDLNDVLRRSPDWTLELPERVQERTAQGAGRSAPTLSR